MISSEMKSAKFAYGKLNVLCTLNYFVAKLTCSQLKANLI